MNIEKLWRQVEELPEPAFTRAVNRAFRDADESHLWPICGQFDATERAIRQAQSYRRDSGSGYGLEYIYLLDGLLSDIVNGAV